MIPTNPKHDPVIGTSHLRWHPLRGEWVAYASHRQNRTFLPPTEYSPLAVTKSDEFPTELPAGEYDMAVFENLFPSLSLEATTAPHEITETEPGRGVCEVVVFSQDPNTSLAKMSIEEIDLLLEVLGHRTQEIGRRPEIKYVLPFENRGVEVGVTLHHPHGQIYAYPFLPPVQQRMLETQQAFLKKTDKNLLETLIQDEIKDGRRIISQNESAVAFVPVCARYTFETWVAPLKRHEFLTDLTATERRALAVTLKTVLMKFDAMWDKPFPYLMSLFQAPTDGVPHPEAYLHFEIFPPYRTRDRLKFLAGTEIGAGLFINDALPEEKAQELRNVEVVL